MTVTACGHFCVCFTRITLGSISSRGRSRDRGAVISVFVIGMLYMGDWVLRGAQECAWATSYMTSKRDVPGPEHSPNSVAPEASFLATIRLHSAGRIQYVISLRLTAAPCEYSYWTHFAFRKLWFWNVNLCLISQPEKWQSQEWVSASSQPPFPGEGFVKTLVRKMRMVKVEMSHSRSWDIPLTIFHHLGTELREEGAVLQVIQLFLQYLRADAFNSFGLPRQQMWHFFHEMGEKKEKKSHSVLSDFRQICPPGLAGFACIVAAV